jgi:hypothetical protein
MLNDAYRFINDHFWRRSSRIRYHDEIMASQQRSCRCHAVSVARCGIGSRNEFQKSSAPAACCRKRGWTAGTTACTPGPAARETTSSSRWPTSCGRAVRLRQTPGDRSGGHSPPATLAAGPRQDLSVGVRFRQHSHHVSLCWQACVYPALRSTMSAATQSTSRDRSTWQ